MVLDIKQNKEIRRKKYLRIINKKINSYINNPKGNLNLSGIGINKLPNNLKNINGSLDISYSDITELSKGIEIKYNINLIGSKINKLPDDLEYVNGYLDVGDTNINKLPNNLKYINGFLCISHTYISELPKGLVINGSLFSSFSFLYDLPEDIIIEGDLYCKGTPLSKKYSKIELLERFNIKADINF